MNLNEYQGRAMMFRLPSANRDYALFNLGGEVGEILSLEAKLIRDGGNMDLFLANMKKELGDVLWHVAAIARDNGFSLAEVAEANLDKLASRKARNAITGSGDDR